MHMSRLRFMPVFAIARVAAVPHAIKLTIVNCILVLTGVVILPSSKRDQK